MASTGRAVAREEVSTVLSTDKASGTGVSWPAVFAGAFAMGALSLILMVLGAGVGLSSVSPWPEAGATAARISGGAVIWLIFVQLAASAVGGYLAGRLRTKWVALHTHEVFFRDTAHGFIAWCVALVVTTILFASYAASVATRTATLTADNQSADYFAGRLFRSDHLASVRVDQPLRNEAALVLANALRHPETTRDDQTYLISLVAAATGMSQAEAESRVNETVAADREAADSARKAVAHSLYWLFVAFLIGAFCASYAATIGGRQRDHVPALT